MSTHDLTRRAFLATATTTAVTFAAAQPNTAQVVPGKKSPNEKLNIATIGAGGKGTSDTRVCQELGENIVALCDVDDDRGARTFNAIPNAKRYKDYRNMLEAHPEIDAVLISCPDHTHATAAYMAMQMGKHVYVQKPLTHTIAEARLLANTAKETGVMTQMGNQGHSGDGARELCEMIWDGAIGEVREAHVWTHRPVWANQGVDKPFPPEVTPEGLDWDRWLGPAPWRPFNRVYAPHDWRAWQDFGSGSLGDMACHIMDPIYWSLKLYEAPSYTVEVVMQKGENSETFPIASTIKYSFPARAGMGPVDVYWYDGHWEDANGKTVYNRPVRPDGVPADTPLGDSRQDDRSADGVVSNGSFLIGATGILTTGEYGGATRFVPEARNTDYKKPEPVIPRIPRPEGAGDDVAHKADWIQGCKGGTVPCSNFAYSGPFTEMVQFGNLVVKSGQKLEWDNVRGVVTNVPNAAEIVSKEYRKGWELPI